jgi:hypothetical protein
MMMRPLLIALATTLPADGPRAWDFDTTPVGSTPEGLRPEVGTWEVVASDGGRALKQTAQNEDDAYNVALIDGTEAADVDLSVRFRAVAGRLDQGGGLVWRARDARNYYVARYNPLEENLRVYKVVHGIRSQLNTAEIPHTPGWHTLRITMTGDHIRCYYEGRPALDLRDPTFAEPGLVGLWSKSDARTEFDDLELKRP